MFAIRIAKLGSVAAAMMVAAAPVAHAQAIDTTSARAIEAFDQVCLKNATSLAGARTAATSAPWSFVRKGDLPSLVGGPAMETYASGNVELLLRPAKKGFGCLVTYELAEAATTTESLTGSISAIPGLALKGSGKDKVRVKWKFAQPAGSEVVLTVYPDLTPRAPILALESKGSSN